MTKSKGQQATSSLLPISKISTNKGQIHGLPRNPRVIRDSRFESLKKSITDYPEMLELREVIVFPHRGRYVAIAGNQRYLACKDLAAIFRRSRQAGYTLFLKGWISFAYRRKSPSM